MTWIDRLIDSPRVYWWLAVLGVGAVQFQLFFADLSPGENVTMRLLTFVLVSLAGGITLGLFGPRTWFWLCAAASWGGVVSGLMMVLMNEQRFGLLIVATSLGVTIVGGLLGVFLRVRTALNGPRDSRL